jgi:formylmethanofuran dehydrogenase subunit E
VIIANKVAYGMLPSHLTDEMIEENEKVEYKGLYSHLSSIDFDKVIEGVTKEEEKQTEKEYKEQVKQKLKYINQDSYNINKVLNKEKETEEEEKQNKRECLIFLNNLQPTEE